MKLNGRSFLAMAGIVAVAGIVGMSAEAPDELNSPSIEEDFELLMCEL